MKNEIAIIGGGLGGPESLAPTRVLHLNGATATAL